MRKILILLYLFSLSYCSSNSIQNEVYPENIQSSGKVQLYGRSISDIYFRTINTANIFYIESMDQYYLELSLVHEGGAPKYIWFILGDEKIKIKPVRKLQISPLNRRFVIQYFPLPKEILPKLINEKTEKITIHYMINWEKKSYIKHEDIDTLQYFIFPSQKPAKNTEKGAAFEGLK